MQRDCDGAVILARGIILHVARYVMAANAWITRRPAAEALWRALNFNLDNCVDLLCDRGRERGRRMQGESGRNRTSPISQAGSRHLGRKMLWHCYGVDRRSFDIQDGEETMRCISRTPEPVVESMRPFEAYTSAPLDPNVTFEKPSRALLEAIRLTIPGRRLLRNVVKGKIVPLSLWDGRIRVGDQWP